MCKVFIHICIYSSTMWWSHPFWVVIWLFLSWIWYKISSHKLGSNLDEVISATLLGLDWLFHSWSWHIDRNSGPLSRSVWIKCVFVLSMTQCPPDKGPLEPSMGHPTIFYPTSCQNKKKWWVDKCLFTRTIPKYKKMAYKDEEDLCPFLETWCSHPDAWVLDSLGLVELVTHTPVIVSYNNHDEIYHK